MLEGSHVSYWTPPIPLGLVVITVSSTESALNVNQGWWYWNNTG